MKVRLLVALTSFSVTLSIALGAYLAVHVGWIKRLEASLLSREELQKRILVRSPLDQCLMPHVSSEIGFVLDPARALCTMWLEKGQAPYTVNALGLRGPELRPKRSGTKRVLIVGDSWVFGWKLNDEDTLAAQLQRRVDAASRGSFEFLTVALPGWNTRSEAAFVRIHSPILDPDFIVWQVSQNDVVDSMGVIPPGIGSILLSSQVVDRSPLTHLARRGDWPSMYWYTTCPMPYITERWLHNFSLIRAVRDSLGVPVLTLFAGVDPRFLAYLGRREQADLPMLFEPASIDGDPRWAAGSNDGHPTSWGASMMALPILERMSAMGFDTGVALDDAEQELAARWRTPGDALPDADAVNRWLRDYAAQVPESYDPTAPETEIPGDGVREEGRMADNGVLYLRVEPAKGDQLELQLESLEERPRGRSIAFTVSSFTGATVVERFDFEESLLRVRLALPARDPAFPLIELRWQFDSMRCQGTLKCDSGILKRVAPLL